MDVLVVDGYFFFLKIYQFNQLTIVEIKLGSVKNVGENKNGGNTDRQMSVNFIKIDLDLYLTL